MITVYKRFALIVCCFLLLVACKDQESSTSSRVSEIRDPDIANTQIVENMETVLQDNVQQEVEHSSVNFDAEEGKVVYPSLTSEELEEIKPNELGRIMVVMFHNFEETFQPTNHYNGDYTTTFDEFKDLLLNLYERDYRLISMEDFLNDHITIEPGKIPMIFTFDDATSGQFHLIEQNGEFVVNPRSAVGIMEKFHEDYPDFGEKGVFYINLGNQVFPGAGTIKDRLSYLIDKGYEIGNHSKTHLNLTSVKEASVVQSEVGGNQKAMQEIIPDYDLKTFSLPFGAPAGDLKSYVINGEYDGVKYENQAIMEVGWQPTYGPAHKALDLYSVNRVRASGINPVQADLAWWLENLSRKEQYISDGNPDTITISEDQMTNLNRDKLGNKKLITY